MPESWQGPPPPLPPEVVAELAERARLAAIQEEQDRKARLAAELDPKVQVRVGRNASFVRLQFDWTVPPRANLPRLVNWGRCASSGPSPSTSASSPPTCRQKSCRLAMRSRQMGRPSISTGQGRHARFYEISRHSIISISRLQR